MKPAPREIKAAEGNHLLVATYRNWPEQRHPVYADHTQTAEVNFWNFAYGSRGITSAPAGAIVWQGGRGTGPHAVAGG